MRAVGGTVAAISLCADKNGCTLLGIVLIVMKGRHCILSSADLGAVVDCMKRLDCLLSNKVSSLAE